MADLFYWIGLRLVPFGLKVQNFLHSLSEKDVVTGIIIAPGGVCVALAIDLEGYPVARRLQEKGFASLVLKYRSMPQSASSGNRA